MQEGSEQAEDEDLFPGTDYGRACRIDDYLGTLRVGPGEALVLGDLPLLTGFVPAADGGLLVRWHFASGEEDVLRALRAGPEPVWEPTPHRLRAGSAGLLVFDSAYAGDDLPTEPLGGDLTDPWLLLMLREGRYDIDTAEFQPDPSTSLLLHRFRMCPGCR